MGIDPAMDRVTECARQRSDNGKPQPLPEAYRTFISRYDEVELNCGEAEPRSFGLRMFAQGSGNAFAACCLSGHVTTIGDMIATTEMIGFHDIGSDRNAFAFCNETPLSGAHPEFQRVVSADVAGQGIGLTCAQNRLDQ